MKRAKAVRLDRSGLDVLGQPAQQYGVGLADSNVVQEKEKGESREATRTRDAKLDDLYDWFADFRDVAVIALDGNPEWIEIIRKGEVDYQGLRP